MQINIHFLKVFDFLCMGPIIETPLSEDIVSYFRL